MLSIFGADLTAPSARGLNPCGAGNGITATAMTRAIAEHFDLPFDAVQWVLKDFFPQSRHHLDSVRGWLLFGQLTEQTIETAITAPFTPTVH